MTLMELRAALEAGGAVYGQHFTFGGLGSDVHGIEFVDGAFRTYRAELRGAYYRKTDYVSRASEEEACIVLKAHAIAAAKADGVWEADAGA